MADAILAGIIGFIAGGIASIIAPWVNWGVERQRERLKNRQRRIDEWRQMVIALRKEYEEAGNRHGDFFALLERQPGYLSFVTQISRAEIDVLKKIQGDLSVVNIVVHGHKHEINPIDRFVARLAYKIGKIEEEWDLV